MRTSGGSDDEKEIFAFYGLALYKSQCLERGLSILFAHLAVPARTHRYALEDRMAENFEATFGILVERARSIEALEGLRDELSDLVELRNNLAHHFFWDHAP